MRRISPVFFLFFALVLIPLAPGCEPKTFILGCRVNGEEFEDSWVHYGTIGDPLAVVVWWDIGLKGSSGNTSGSSSSTPGLVVLEGLREELKGRRDVQNASIVKWKITTADGEARSITINGQLYNTDDGKIFLVRTKGDFAKVTQVKHDISAMQPGTDTWRRLADDNAQIKEFLAEAKRNK